MPEYEGSGTDNFSLDNYDADRIYAKAYNQYGTGAGEIRVAVSRGVLAAMHEVVSNKDIPYRSLADMARDSFVHRLWHWHQKSEDEIFDPVALRFAEAEAESELLDRFEALVKQRTEQYEKARGSYKDYIVREIQTDLTHIPDRFDWIKDALARLT